MTGDLRGRLLSDYLAALGSSSPTPGGGSAAALSGSFASALGSMVVSVAYAKEPTAERESLVLGFRDLESQFLTLAAEDERAFAAVMEAARLSKSDASRPERLQRALEGAAAVPLKAAYAAGDVLQRLLLAEPHATRSIVSDIGVAAHLALAAARSSLLSVRADLRSMTDPDQRGQLEEACATLALRAESAHAALVSRVEKRLSPRGP